MKNIFTVLFLSLMIYGLHAQTPKWTNYDYNSSNYSLTSTFCVAADPQSNNIWIGTNRSIVKFNQTNTWTVYDNSNTGGGMPNDNVYDMFVTSTGSVWFCTYGSGFNYYNGVSLWVNKTPSTTSNSMPTNYTYCMTQDNGGNFWVGIYSGNNSNTGLVKWDGANTWTPFTFRESTTGNYKNVESIAADNQGNIWCGTAIGVFKYNSQGTLLASYTKENTSGGLCGNYVRSIGVNPATGDVWFGCMDKDPVTGYWIEGGASKLNGTTWTSYKPSGGGLTNGYVSAFAFKGSDVYVGTGFCGQYSGHGLYKLSGTTWTNYYNDPNTYNSTCVNDMAVDKNGNLWIAGANILSKLDFNPTAVDEKEELPSAYKLDQNYPNPFNPETVISYQLPAGGKVRLSVTDLLGREVGLIVDEFQSAGTHNAKLSIQNYQLSSGVYFYKLQTEKYSEVKKMVVMK